MIMFGSGPAAADQAAADERPTGAVTPAVTADPPTRRAGFPTPSAAPERVTDTDAIMADPPGNIGDRVREPDPDPGTSDDGVIAPAEEGKLVPLARPVVALYGDSLAWEARHVFEQAFADHPDVQVVTRTFGGTAICDWLDEMAADAETLAPGLVVIEFVGNNYTPCMQDLAGEPLIGAALTDRYAADAEAAIAMFTPADTQVVLAGAPISQPATASLDLHRAPLNAVYEDMGQRLDGVHYVDAGSTLLDDGEWTATLPCLPLEPCVDGTAESGAVNVVRAPDGLHFCPAGADAPRGVTGDCPVWSSGAFRYGAALAQPVLEILDATALSPADDA